MQKANKCVIHPYRPTKKVKQSSKVEIVTTGHHEKKKKIQRYKVTQWYIC